MDKFTRRSLFALLALAALGLGAYRCALYRYHVTDIPFRGLWKNELGVTVDFRSDRTAVIRLPDDRPDICNYRVLSSQKWMEQQRAEIGITASLDEMVPGVTHVVEPYSTDNDWLALGPTFFYCADTDSLYAPPFFGQFRRAGEAISGARTRRWHRARQALSGE